ncbi:MAG TPA: biopolymer transporter ExbD [Candidatus Binatia bacterium]|nr:biopolymer transporter ExbD [Candidatus Binatia bacterium]
MSLSPVEMEGGEDIVAEINVTPLTDIFLVLLIIFMVTSTALTQQGTKVNLPRAGGGGAEAASVIVTATADHRLELNGKPVARDALLPALQAALANAAEKHVILQGDRSVILEDAVQIMTTAKEAGAEKIAIATEPKAAKP